MADSYQLFVELFFKEYLAKVAGLCIGFCFTTDTDKPPGLPSICWYLTDPTGAAIKDETLGIWQGPDEDDKSLVLWYEHPGR